MEVEDTTDGGWPLSRIGEMRDELAEKDAEIRRLMGERPIHSLNTQDALAEQERKIIEAVEILDWEDQFFQHRNVIAAIKEACHEGKREIVTREKEK